MAAGFGFQGYSQPSPQMVGGLLANQGPSAPPPEAPMPDPSPPPSIGTPDWSSATKQALLDAVQRTMNGRTQGQNPQLPNPLHKLQLIQLGVPEQEADLLEATGGSNP